MFMFLLLMLFVVAKAWFWVVFFCTFVALRSFRVVDECICMVLRCLLQLLITFYSALS